jgi:hypothetical protein
MTDLALLEYSSHYKCILAAQLEFQAINSNLQAQIWTINYFCF